MSGWMGVDLAAYGLDDPVTDVESNAIQSVATQFAEDEEHGRGWTVGDLARNRSIGGLGPTLVGSGEQHWAVVHVDDLATLYVAVLESGRALGRVLAASTERVTLRDLGEATGSDVVGEAEFDRAEWIPGVLQDLADMRDLRLELVGEEDHEADLVDHARSLHVQFEVDGASRLVDFVFHHVLDLHRTMSSVLAAGSAVSTEQMGRGGQCSADAWRRAAAEVAI